MGKYENQEKSIFSCVVWAVFALYCGFGIFSVLRAAGAAEISGLSLPVLAGGAFAYLYFLLAAFDALGAAFGKIGKRAEKIFGIVLPAFLLLAAAADLAFWLMNSPMPTAPQSGSFYGMALDLEGDGVPFAVHGASWLYACLLRGIFLMSDDPAFAGLMLQAALFCVCLLMLYAGMCLYTGALSAAVSVAAFVLFPLSKECVFSMTPGLFFLAFYLAGFCLTGVLYRSFSRENASSQRFPGRQYLFSLFVGLYVGFLAYLDLGGLSLFLLLAALFWADQKKGRQALFANVIALSGGILGFFHAVSVVVLSAGNLIEGGNFIGDFGILLEKFTSFYAEKTDFWVSGAPAAFGAFGAVPALSIALISLAFLNVPAFFGQKRSPAGAFVLSLILTNVLFFSGVTGLDKMELFGEQGHIAPILGWCMLAGLGIWGIIRGKKEMGIGGFGEVAAEGEGSGKRSAIKKVVWASPEGQEAHGQEASSTGKSATDKPAPGEPLHNPLPVPKKKSRLKADFDYEVADSDLKFDIEVAEDADFDV